MIRLLIFVLGNIPGEYLDNVFPPNDSDKHPPCGEGSLRNRSFHKTNNFVLNEVPD